GEGGQRNMPGPCCLASTIIPEPASVQELPRDAYSLPSPVRIQMVDRSLEPAISTTSRTARVLTAGPLNGCTVIVVSLSLATTSPTADESTHDSPLTSALRRSRSRLPGPRLSTVPSALRSTA